MSMSNPSDPQDNDTLKKQSAREGSDDEAGGEVIQVDERLVRAFEHVAMQVSQGQALPDIEAEHVSELLAIADKADSRSHLRGMTLLCGGLGIGIALLIFILLLSWLFLAYSKGDLLVPVISAFGGLVTGLLGGFGMGAAYQKSQQDRSE